MIPYEDRYEDTRTLAWIHYIDRKRCVRHQVKRVERCFRSTLRWKLLGSHWTWMASLWDGHSSTIFFSLHLVCHLLRISWATRREMRKKGWWVIPADSSWNGVETTVMLMHMRIHILLQDHHHHHHHHLFLHRVFTSESICLLWNICATRQCSNLPK